MNNWQPINTAPKDKRILLSLHCNTVLIGRFDYDEWTNDCGYILDIENGYGKPIAWQELPIFDGVIAE